MEMYRRVIFCQLFLWMFNCFANLHHVGTGLEEILNNKNDASIGDFNLLSFDYDHDDIMVYKFLETQKNSYILFICDKEGNHYIVKQEKGRELFQQFRALSETLCAHIASELNIPSHHVRLLPINRSFPGKFITKRVATIHTLVPGCTIRTLANDKYGKLDIKQATDKNIPFDRQGFTERTIYYMALHPQLSKIVALDTFTGNKDRNKANILYDALTDSFYAIDMALMYDVLGDRKSVSHLACEQVMNMIKQNKKFTQEEIESLSLYRFTLQELVRFFPPKKVGELLDSFVIESGLIGESSPFDEKEVYSLLNMYKRAIKQSYTDTKKLIYLLFILINS